MDWTLIYGLLIATGLLAVVWFALVMPSQRRDHERRLALIQKRLAERQRHLDGRQSSVNDGSSGYRDNE
jgi:predicted MFS family arabinose efflux permease